MHRLQSIDSIAVTQGILEYIEECTLLSHNEIIPSNHRAYMVDINMEEYFQDYIS